MPTMINPLRYPGAKRSLTNYIEALLQANHLEGCTFLEPYAGSAAVGLELLQRNRIDRLVLCEKEAAPGVVYKANPIHIWPRHVRGR